MSFLSFFGFGKNKNKVPENNNINDKINVASKRQSRRLSVRPGRNRSDSMAALENLVPPMFKEKSDEYKSLSADQDVQTEQIDTRAPPGKKSYPIKFINAVKPPESWKKGTLEISEVGVTILDERGITEAVYQFSLIRTIRNTGLSIEFMWRDSPAGPEKMNTFQTEKPLEVYEHFINWIQYIVAVRKASGK